MEKAKKKLGSRIKKLREAQARTQNDLAALTNLSLKNLGELERGRGNPSLKSLASLAEVLNVSLADLLDFEQEQKTDDEIRKEIYTRLLAAKPEVLRTILRILTP